MKKSKTILLILLVFLCCQPFDVTGQSIKDYFIAVEQRIQGYNSFARLYDSLNNFMQQHIPSRSGLSVQLDRPLDAGYTHKRVQLQLNFNSFQLDFITNGDSIYFTALTAPENKRLRFFNPNEVMMVDFLNKRNKLYRSKKNLADIKEELTYPIPLLCIAVIRHR